MINSNPIRFARETSTSLDLFSGRNINLIYLKYELSWKGAETGSIFKRLASERSIPIEYC